MTPVYEVSNGMTQVDVNDFAAVIDHLTDSAAQGWDALVDNTDDIFCGFSYVDKTIATIINNHVGRADRVRIIGLDNNQRHKFYKGLSLDIHFTKERVHRMFEPPGTPHCGCNIIIHLNSTEYPLWTIPSYSEYNRKYCHPEILDDPSAPENPRTFYHRIDLIAGAYTIHSELRNVVTLEEYIRFEKLSRWYWIIRREHVNQLNQQQRIHTAQISSQRPTPNFTQADVRQAYRTRIYSDERRNANSNNRNVRLQLSDMVFDIKDKISDAEFKVIMDKMLEFVC